MNDCENCKKLEEQLRGRQHVIDYAHEEIERKQLRIDNLVNQINTDWKQIYELGATPKVL